jgi:hypothetical protein
MDDASQLAEPDFRLHLAGALMAERYRALSLLGKGGFGLTYLAADELAAGRKVVLRIPHAEFLADPELAPTFERECLALGALAHPGVARVLDHGVFRDTPFAVAEYAPGGNVLGRLASSGALPSPVEVLEWLWPVAEALDHLHELGFLHRDVKPENVLFAADGRPMLADFAIARALRALELTRGASPRVVGTPPYMAPEVLATTAAEPSYDQYSLAVTVYQCLSARLPLPWNTPMSMLLLKTEQLPAQLGELRPDLPERAAAAVMRALSSEPIERFPSCLDLARAIADALPGGAGSHRAGGPAAAAAERVPAAAAGAASGSRVPAGLIAAACLTAGVMLGLGAGTVLWPAGPLPASPEDPGLRRGASSAAGNSSGPDPAAAVAPDALAQPGPPALTAEDETRPADAAAAQQGPQSAAAEDEPRPAVATAGADARPTAPLSAGASENVAGEEQGRNTWQPLVTGASLPGWRTQGKPGWGVEAEGVLRLQEATALTTESTFGALALTVRARPLEPGTIFGLAILAEDGGRDVRLELGEGQDSLRLGERLAPVGFEWKPGASHQVALIARAGSVLAYIDRKKVAELEDTELGGLRRIGVFCGRGSVELRSMHVQRLD